jgi:hypothetical protein
LDIDVTLPIKEEIRWALRNMKNRKAPGIDNISASITIGGTGNLTCCILASLPT